MRKKCLVHFCLAVLLLLPLIVGFNADTTTLDKLNGQSITYHDLMSGSPQTVILLWQSGCYYCRKELQKLDSSCDTNYGANPETKFYFVNLGENRENVEATAARLRLQDCSKENIVLDTEGALIEIFDVVFIPMYLFVKNGRVVRMTGSFNRTLEKQIFGND